MKYKIGDKVRVKSLDWYNENNINGDDILENIGIFPFFPYMAKFCGQVLTIKDIHITYYTMEETDYYTCWTDEMIEGLVEEETKYGTASNPVEPKSNANCLTRERVDALAIKIDKELPSGNQNVWELPDGYQFVDENGNVINAMKIVLEKKKKEYPKTFKECQDYLGEDVAPMVEPISKTHRRRLVHLLEVLLACRDAYWKIAGEEMRLGKPWEPDYDSGVDKFGIVYFDNTIMKTCAIARWERHLNKILEFPTEEMRDAFYENFKELIEQCKELL